MRLADHYADPRFREPAWIEYARERLKEMKAEPSGVFKDFGKMVKERLDASRAAG